MIIVVIGNSKIDDKVQTPFHTRRVWKALCQVIDRALKARKNDLPKKAYLNEEPRVFFTEMFPTHRDHSDKLGEGFDPYKSKRRQLNNVLPQVLKEFNFELLQINGIDPNIDEYFVRSTGQLTGKATEVFWTAVARELKLADEKLKEKIKNNIIRSYLEEQQKNARLQRERQRITQQRFSMPWSFPKHHFARGDADSNVGNDNTRSFKQNNNRSGGKSTLR